MIITINILSFDCVFIDPRSVVLNEQFDVGKLGIRYAQKFHAWHDFLPTSTFIFISFQFFIQHEKEVMKEVLRYSHLQPLLS